MHVCVHVSGGDLVSMLKGISTFRSYLILKLFL